MKLLSQISRQYKDKKYHKHWIVIPNDIVEKLEWDEGDELKAEVKNEKLIIEKHKKD
jgi:AbrB family looped-hinge helix DNA binding protein